MTTIKAPTVAIFFLLSGSALAQSGVCIGTANQGTPCTSDSACTGAPVNSCVIIKHVVFIIKENRSFDHLFGRFPGTTAVCSGGTNAGAACIAPNDSTSQCSGGGTCPFITTANCYNGNTTQGGCPAANDSQATMDLIDGNPNLGDADCGHSHSNVIADYHFGAMDKFNWSCGTSTDWAKQYSSLAADHRSG